ncbi:hypothetical protein M1C57_13115 [Rhodococcus pyridinivorans]|uniref:Uncharacterized protein n=1 Tax=Rhodococcus sp. D-6 TaxID=1387842 RepID=A0AAU7UUZ3_9NOCA|nr:hypothetical protein [Rhodococcus pyridinivorans]UPW02661.1 hypothetical protein M1C57_13115 [Rhodococcus pyridinivorans]USI90406.1 hypothetical protein LLA01_00125 [Rhodococcus pyridinivorans]WMM72798.1 hypothetical protein RCF27_00085 [Rhodococcus pyridinivorans]
MTPRLSPRLAEIVAVLPLEPHLRVLDQGRCTRRSAPEAGRVALERIAAATRPDARLFVDGGDPLRELVTPR